MVVHFQICYTNSTILQYSCIMPKILNSCETLHMLQKLESFGVPMISNLPSYLWLFSLAFFCTTSTQTAFMWMVSSNRVQRSLAVEAINCWTGYKDHAPVSYVQITGHRTHSLGIWQWYERRARCRNPQYLARILWLHPLMLVTWALHIKRRRDKFSYMYHPIAILVGNLYLLKQLLIFGAQYLSPPLIITV